MISVDAPPRLGGVATTAHHLANTFADMGGGAALLGPRGTSAPVGLARRYALVEDWESRVDPRCGRSPTEEDARIAALVARTIEVCGAEAILLAHGHHYGPGALRAARAADIPIGVLAHGLEIASHVPMVHGWVRRSRMPRIDRDDARARLWETLKGVDQVFANSASTRAMLSRAGVPATVCGVGLCAETLRRETALSPDVDPDARIARRRALGFGDAPLIVSLGRLVRHKRVDRALDLAASLPDAVVAIAGSGPERAALELRARQHGLGERVRFLGEVPEDAKWALLRAADFHVLFSESDPTTGAHEGFGLVLLEGCAAGSTALGTGADGAAEFLVEARGGLALDPAQPISWADRVTRLGLAERRALVARGRAAIAARWTWPRVATRISEALGAVSRDAPLMRAAR